MSRAVLLALLVACGDKAQTPATPVPAAPADAGADAAPQLQPSNTDGVDRSGPKRPGRPIDIVLRSSPVPAHVSVDGEPLGTTPAVWDGTTGAEHLFVFEAPGYAQAKYRFTPVASGLLHPRLERMLDEPTGQAPPPPEVVPHPPPAPIVDVDAQPAPLAPPPVPLAPPPVDAAPGGLGPIP